MIIIEAPDGMDEVCINAINFFGKKNQLLKCSEELTELYEQMAKQFSEQVGARAADVVDEIADVFIMITQMAIIFGINNVNERVRFKLDRLKQRMAE